MQGVLQGFAIILLLIGAGLAAAVLLPSKRDALARGMTPLIYYLTNPALMFILLSETDLRQVAGVFTPIALLVAVLTAGLYALVSRLAFKTRWSNLPSAAMSTSYVNAGNIGVPLALYAVGSTVPVVSVLLAQLLLIAPFYLCLFALIAKRRQGADSQGNIGRTILRSIANPLTTMAFLGALFSFAGWRLPGVLHAPLQMLGDASVPLLLVAFGLALYGQKPLANPSIRAEVYVGTAFKLFVAPAIAWVAGSVLFHLQGVDLLGVVMMAALPTAQNVLLFSQQFKLPVDVPREIILLSTLLTLPVILLITLVLG
ncbi:AEC family transporter [Glutamicibacter sp.]|uniref:AEC family transporter n=1 Tax=Glutamicibacter sp. TaxID=1931995 RepID=UPI0028BF14AC|nr:AEC family transporter [Glutamicibacter sp.]